MNLASPEDAVAAAQAMSERLLVAEPGAVVDGFLIQQMVDGLEVIVGVRDDPQFGAVLALGIGGVMVEAMRDVAFRLLPVTGEDVGDMMSCGQRRCWARSGAPPRAMWMR